MANEIEWLLSDGLVEYRAAVSAMETRVRGVLDGTCRECIWFLEHHPVYTCGVSASDSDILDKNRFLIHRTGRGGGCTYHGPGQRIVYVLLNLERRCIGVRDYIAALESWVIRVLSHWGIYAKKRPGYTGVWVQRADKVDKIAAIGVRVRRWITMHGISININPDLEHFSGIIPCGVTDGGVTSFSDLGIQTKMSTVDVVLRSEFDEFLTSLT